MSDITFDTFINVIKRPEQVLYRTNVKSSSANVSFVGGDEISSGANISIIDMSFDKPANRAYENEVFTYSNVSSFQIESKNFLLTDIYNSSISSGSIIKTPLFYKHKFKLNSGETIKPGSVKIYDDLGNEIVISEQYTSSDYFYSNLESLYNLVGTEFVNSEVTEYTYYRIGYGVLGSVNRTSSELLNNVPVFREATVEDFDFDIGIMSTSSKAYTLTEIDGGFLINTYNPADLSYKIKDDQRLKIVLPTSKNYTDPWNIRVPNNEIVDQGTVYRISLEQFIGQDFNPIFGVKKVEKELPTLITKKTIKTDYDNLLEDANLGLYLRIRITRNSVTSYYTTNPNGETFDSNSYTAWDSSSSNPIGIQSIDSRTGFVDFDGLELKFTDTIECDYYYKEDYFELEDIDFNPIRNNSILDKTTVVYIDPDSTSNSTLFVKQFDWNGGALDSGDNYTAWVTNSPNYFILGKIKIVEAKSINDLISLDTRIEGGAIKESKTSEVETQYPDYDSTWDNASFDGKPYPGNLCYHLEIPIAEIVKGFGGIHSPKEIKTIAGKHTALGAYIIARGYGAEIKITSFDMFKAGASVSVKINWIGVDTYRYKVFYKEKSASSWTVSSTQFNEGSSNVVISLSDTITGLAGHTNYQFIVVGGTGTHASFTQLITQHIDDMSSTLKEIENNPDLAKVIEIKTLQV